MTGRVIFEGASAKRRTSRRSGSPPLQSAWEMQQRGNGHSGRRRRPLHPAGAARLVAVRARGHRADGWSSGSSSAARRSSPDDPVEITGEPDGATGDPADIPADRGDRHGERRKGRARPRLSRRRIPGRGEAPRRAGSPPRFERADARAISVSRGCPPATTSSPPSIDFEPQEAFDEDSSRHSGDSDTGAASARARPHTVALEGRRHRLDRPGATPMHTDRLESTVVAAVVDRPSR